MFKYLKENDFFTTPDICLGATILYFGYKIECVENKNNKTHFSFRRDKKLDDLIQDHLNHLLKVEPMMFFEKTKELKKRIHFGI